MEAGLDVTNFFEGLNLLLYAAVFVITGAIRHLTKDFFDKDPGARFLPVVPMLIGAVLAMLGVCDLDGGLLNKAIFGLISGAIVGHAYKTGRTSILGYGLPGQLPKPEGTEEGK